MYLAIGRDAINRVSTVDIASLPWTSRLYRGHRVSTIGITSLPKHCLDQV